ncbi:MAG TPA: hypothetical protein VLG12_08760 [Candidatus Saccharimonadales bacterium]|nr:hypothetical protein [Candidatus Saccharimonadales bacterium]
MSDEENEGLTEKDFEVGSAYSGIDRFWIPEEDLKHVDKYRSFLQQEQEIADQERFAERRFQGQLDEEGIPPYFNPAPENMTQDFSQLNQPGGNNGDWIKVIGAIVLALLLILLLYALSAH